MADLIAGYSRKTVRGFSVLLLSLVISACAVSYDDSAGRRHVVGFVDVALLPNDTSDALAGDVLRTTSLGMLVSRHGNETTLGIGYTSESTADIRDNAFVLGNPNQELSSIVNGGRK